MENLEQFEAWFVTGSLHLYPEEALRKVAEHSREIAQALSQSDRIPVKVERDLLPPGEGAVVRMEQKGRLLLPAIGTVG